MLKEVVNSWNTFACDGVQGLQPYIPGKSEDTVQRELGLDKIVKLASNENPLGPSPNVVSALNAFVSSKLGRYPDASGYRIKQVLSEYYGISMNQITLGNGSNDILDTIGRVFLQPQRNCVYSEHAFVVYHIVTKATGATSNIVKAINFGHDLSKISKAINAQTSLVFLANPNNPTGTFFTKTEFIHFMQQVPSNVVVVLDEAYTEYLDQSLQFDSLKLVDEYSNLIVSRTFSKAYALAGLRFGFCVANEEITDLLNRVRQPFNVNTLAQVAAEAALLDEVHLKKTVQLNNEGLAFWQDAFHSLDLEFIPSYGNFITVKLPGLMSDNYQKLQQQGVIIRPVENYGLNQMMRLTVGTPEENTFALQGLKKVLEK